MQLESIHHVAINVSDYNRAKEFYVNLLGFQVLGEYVFPSGTQRMDCQLANVRLEIFCSRKITQRPQKPSLGYRHLCLKPADIYETVVELKAAGVKVEEIRPDPMTGGMMTFFEDPEGLILELHE